MLTRTLLLAFAFVATLRAQSCPNQVTETVPMQITARAPLTCDDPTLIWRPMGAPQAIRGCPGVVVVEPRHDTWRAMPGSGTYVRPAGRAQVMALTFTCKTTWLLFIPLSTNCELADKRVIAYLTNYEQLPCPVIQTNTSTNTSTTGI